MAARADDRMPVGISLTGESCGGHGTSERDAILGFIVISPSKAVVSDLREIFSQQLETVPASYRFLTKQGWPVRRKQETQLKAIHLINKDDVIRLQRDFGEPRVGVVSETGIALGFVFMSTIQLNINRLRQAILAQFSDSALTSPHPTLQRVCSIRIEDANKAPESESQLCSDFDFETSKRGLISTEDMLGSAQDLTRGEWVFLDRNGWPINKQQESTLTILDILVNASVRVRVHDALIPVREQAAIGVETPRATAVLGNMALLASPAKMQRVRAPSPVGSLDNVFAYAHGTKLAPTTPLPNPDLPFNCRTPSAKEILISYVRAEATQYALDLKTELEALEFSVYLDVHEIFCGTDWQDSLNFAVSNCEVFVPLVTPRYGETQWTNREVKLADVLAKFIVPISFLDAWPPRCLAIQFATTQFVNWKQPKPGEPATPHSPTQDMSLESFSHRSWEKPDVAKVAKEIGKRCHTAAKTKSVKGAMPANAPVTRVKSMSFGESVVPLIGGREGGKQLLVISIHPKQIDFGRELTVMFERRGYDVWMTTELLKFSGSDAASDSTLILEGDDEIREGSIPPQSATLFQEKVDESSAVIFVLSKAFAASSTCKGQVFYCEQRKRVVPLAYEDFEMPGWMSMLIGTSTFENVARGDYRDHLVNRITRVCDPATLDNAEDIAKETQLTLYVEFVCKNLPDTGCVYIAGGTKFYYDKSEAICKAIGIALARLPTVTLITGGFFGVGDIVSKSFLDERNKRGMDHRVWHILPKKDERDCTSQARQKPDKSFMGPPFGKTLFCGESVRQRETIVSKVFDICIIIEGGPGAAHEAEEFTWSDHTVIPIKCTGGAAGGKFKVPSKIFELPPGVSRTDWQLLGEKAPPGEIGVAVANIVRALQEGVISQVTCQKSFRQRPTLSRGQSVTSSSGK